MFVGSTKVGKVNLKSSSKAARMFTLPALSLRTAAVKVKVLTDGKLVLVDALGLSAS